MRNPAIILAGVVSLLALGGAANAQFLAFDNLAAPSAASAASSVVDLNATWGDRVSLTTGGILSGFQCTIFNSSTGNTLPITTTTLNIAFFDAATFNPTGTNTPIGAFNSSINFGAGLNAGFFSVIAFAPGSIDPLGIVLPQDIVITQRLSNVLGGSTRAGVVFFTAENVGSQFAANNDHFRSNTVNGTGLFNTSTNKIGYSVTIAAPEPGSMALLGLGGLGALGVLRRRKTQA